MLPVGERVRNIINRLLKRDKANRRRHQRYRVVDGVYAVLNNPETHGERIQIIDICEGGLAFVYAFLGNEIREEGAIDIMKDGRLLVEDVPYDTISDEELAGISSDMVKNASARCTI